MHIHILGIAGTFMGSIAIIAKQAGYTVSGMDTNIYPPMSIQLKEQNIDYIDNYKEKNLPNADIFIIGNSLSRGNECVEKILNKRYKYTSGPQWLSEKILKDKWVLSVAGTHGKTTTTSMLAWILEYAGYNPSFLIGGVANNFGISSRLTNSDFFIIEADEYDTAFFDKRSKFIHYKSKTLIINNLEFDHCDIFDSISDIQKQFCHLVRTIPKNGLIIYPQNDLNIEQVIAKGLWSNSKKTIKTNLMPSKNGSKFKIKNNTIDWKFLGEHNMENAIASIQAASHVGITTEISCKALNKFEGVKRRLEIKYQNNLITLYDDFAHHPSSIKKTIAGLRQKVGKENIFVIIELRSNTMKSGFHKNSLVESLELANKTLLLRPKNIDWDIDKLFKKSNSVSLLDSVAEIVDMVSEIKKGHIIVMSNGGFENILEKIKLKI